MGTLYFRGAISVLFCLVWASCNDNSDNGQTAYSDTDAVVDNTSKELRIAIVGAGASGLSAAHTLRKLGYQNIVVFEKEDRPGGKVHSFAHQGSVYELGAVWIGSSYQTILDLAAEYEVAFEEAVRAGVYYDGKFYSYEEYVFEKYSTVELMGSYANLLAMERQFPSIERPGFAGGKDDLHMSLGPFAEKFGVELITNIVASFITGCGYGYYEEVPAQYLLKLIPVIINGTVADMFGMSEGIPMSSFTLGWQELWRKVAADLDVRYEAEVTSVSRKSVDGKPVIEVTAGGKIESFDRLIVSVDPEAYKNFLDLTAEEADIFNRVETYRYAVTLFEAANLPHGSISEHIKRETMGGVNFFAHFHPETNIYTAYQLVPDNFSDDDITDAIKADIEQVGGVFKTLVYRKIWSYFPHFSKEDLDQKMDEKIEALQGRKGAYFVGGLMNFETVENTARFAVDLMQRHFGADRR